jgi:hypothetical protein
MLTGGVGYVFGTIFGVLITGVIQTLIQFNGQLSSWWTYIAVGLLTLVFIGVQSLLAARKTRQLTSARLAQAKKAMASEQPTALGGWKSLQPRKRQALFLGGGALLVIALAVLGITGARNPAGGSATNTPSSTAAVACELKPYRHEQIASLIESGAIIAYERNGGPECVDEEYAVYPDGRIVGDDGTQKIEKQATPEDVNQLLSNIAALGWFTEEMYDTWHTPCGQCYTYYLSISYQGQEKTVQAVDGGTDAPANYWQVVSSINGIIPKFVSQ